MIRTMICLSALSLLLLLPGISGADAHASKGGNGILLGLWKGIDTEDGSESLLSITDNDHDGILDLRLTDTFFSLCVSSGYSSFPGLIEGTATVQNSTITWTYSLNCYDPGTNHLAADVVTGESNIEINRRDKTLTNQFGDVFFRIDQH